MDPIMLFHAAVVHDRFHRSELPHINDRVLADIGLERKGPVILAADHTRLRKILIDAGLSRLGQFIATIITRGGFRPSRN